MASEAQARVSLQEAERRAYAGTAESQDSQLVTMYMHRVHGIGERSSSPAQPLPSDDVLYQHQQHVPRPPKVNQGFITGPAADPRPAARSARSSNPNRKSMARSDKKSNPATVASAPGTDAGSGSGCTSTGRVKVKGSDSAAAANLNNPNPALRAQPSKARSTHASNNRVSASHTLESPPIPSQTVESLASSAEQVGSRRPNQHNEIRACSLNDIAPAATQTVNPAPPNLTLGNDGDDDDDDEVEVDDNAGDHASLETPAGHPSAASILHTSSKKGRRKKMESQSPTQSNDGRSYEQYLPRGDDLMPSSDPMRGMYRSQQSHRSSPTTNTENLTIHDDDTGVVNFDFSALARRDTQVSVPDSLGTDRLQQHPSPDHFSENPETPAPPKNPFAGSKAPLMASSQMFKHTQFSSAYKTFSPTSSRPSPDNLNNPLNSISPNSSPLKRIALGPSPLQAAPSSLPRVPFPLDTSPRQDEEDRMTDDTNVARKDISNLFHLPPRRAPIEIYEPIHKSQQDSAPPAQSESEADSDEDMSDDEARRRLRQRIALKKAEATKRLEAISFERRSHTDDAVVPSTSKEAQMPLSPAAQQYLDQCKGISTRDSQDSVEDTQGVEDSQDDIVQLSADLFEEDHGPNHVENLSSNDAVVPNTDPAREPSAVHTDHIPETSPSHLQLRALGDMMPHSSDEQSRVGSFVKLLGSSGLNSAPLVPEIESSPPFPAAQNGHPEEECIQPHPTADRFNVDNDAPEVPSARSSQPPPAFSTRARLRGTHRQTLATAPPTSPSQRPSSSSTLSKLGTTPTLSDKTTPLTEESPRHNLTPSSTHNDAESSPAVAKAHRQKASKAAVQPEANNPPAPKRRTRKSFASDVSVATDESATSPAISTPPTFEQSTRWSRLGRAPVREPPASRETSRGAKIFAGMAFAISFQSKQQGEKDSHYNSRMALSSQIVNKIKQAGGKVLADGFDKLFEVSPVKNADRDRDAVSSTPHSDEEINLVPAAKETGFTALIADGHSRKVKYMQALALGLPCIHERWITACIEGQKLVPWSDYLLCAGNSSFLADAIRSRQLPYYDAASAKLREVIQDRPRLLDESRILLIMQRADESKKAAYVFLARVLGASLSRVYTIDEARKQLKAREDASHPFDWVYVDEKMVGRADLFTDLVSPPTAGKKRKRRIDMDTSTRPAPKKLRALSDELVIQSLILGRLMEEQEMAQIQER